MCQEQSATITRLTQEMSYLNDQYESMRVQYQRLLSSTATSSDCADLGMFRIFCFLNVEIDRPVLPSF